MSELRASVLAVCLISAAKFLVESLVGASKLRSQVSMILRLLLILAIITPLANSFRSFQLPDISNYQQIPLDTANDLYASALSAEASQNISSVLSEQLAAAEIPCEKITVDVDIFADHSISISKVTVTAEDFEAAAALIRSSLGSETEVINGIEENAVEALD